jgi:hypothetical protein
VERFFINNVEIIGGTLALDADLEAAILFY